MQNNIYIYIAIMVIVTTLIRVIPLTLIRKEITNRMLRSFLYYIPYVTLAVMTFPAILDATGSPISAWAALIVADIRSQRPYCYHRLVLRALEAVECLSAFNLSDFFQKYKKYKK